MRIAFLSYNFGEYCVRLASALSRHAEIMLALPHALAAPHLSLLDPLVDFRPFEAPRLRQPLRQLRTNRRLLRSIERFAPDVIHFQHAHLWFNLALPLLRRYPLVISIHDPRDHAGDRASGKTPQGIKDFGYRRADRLIVHNEQMKQMVIEELRLPAQCIHIVPHVAMGDEQVDVEVPEEKDLILFHGRIWAYKGLDVLIRAEPLISSRVPNAKIVIAGRGDDFAPYRQMMIHPDRFVVHDEFISYRKRSELFQRASVVVLPYVEATQSGVIPVACMHGRPVVATRVGGLPAQVDDGHTGFLVPPRDERALADRIVQLLQDDELRRRLGRNARRKAETEWSAEAVARQTMLVYESAIAAEQTKRSAAGDARRSGDRAG